MEEERRQKKNEIRESQIDNRSTNNIKVKRHIFPKKEKPEKEILTNLDDKNKIYRNELQSPKHLKIKEENNFEKLDHIGKGNVINVSENKYKNYSIGEEDINKIRNSLSLDAIKKGLPTKIKIFKCVIWKNIKPDSNEKTLESFIRRNGTHLFERGGYVVNLPSKHNSISNEISTSNVKSFDEK